MNKNKAFTQYSIDYISIYVVIEFTGNIRKRSHLIFKGKNNKEKYKEWYNKNKEHKGEYGKEYYSNNKEKVIYNVKKYRQENKEKIQEKYKLYYQINKETLKEYKIKYYRKNKEIILNKSKQYRKDNPEIVKIRDAKHSASRKDWGYDPINEPFEDSHFHHLHINNDKNIGIHIPAELHRSISHRNYDKESMDKINDLAFEWLKNNKDY